MAPPATTNGRAQEGLATRPEGFGLTTPFPKLCLPARQDGDSYGLSAGAACGLLALLPRNPAPTPAKAINRLDDPWAAPMPSWLVDKDIRGILHAHTELSDGADTLERMVEATRERGYTYFGVADHSRSAHYDGGLSLDDDRAAARVNRHERAHGARFRIFKGIEFDILADGSLDYPDEVVGAVRFHRGERAQPVPPAEGADRTRPARRGESPHHDPRTHDRPPAAQASRL